MLELAHAGHIALDRREHTSAGGGRGGGGGWGGVRAGVRGIVIMVLHMESLGSFKKTQMPRPHPGPIKPEPLRAGPLHYYYFFQVLQV